MTKSPEKRFLSAISGHIDFLRRLTLTYHLGFQPCF